MHKKELKTILSNNFIRLSLYPILLILTIFIILYFFAYTFFIKKNTSFLLEGATTYNKTVLINESNTISQTLARISNLASILQNEHEALFKHKNLNHNSSVQFDIAPNGVFYKTNKEGSSLYYSSKTHMGHEEQKKARFTENMDLTFQSIIELNPIIISAYFNSYDNMNRFYPYIDKVYEQYGNHIPLKDYNFYYLADKKHNPKKQPVWTDTYLDPSGKGWIISCVVPIYYNNFLEGVTGLDITIESFVKDILTKKLPYDAHMFMVNTEGIILAMPEYIETLLNLKELKKHTYSDLITKTILKPDKFNLFHSKNAAALHFKELIKNDISRLEFRILQKKYIAFQKTVATTQWKLIILIEKDNILVAPLKFQKTAKEFGYLVILFLIIFSILFLFYLRKQAKKVSSSIVHPILSLAKHTENMGNINLYTNLLDSNIKEIDKLNTNFLYMRKKLISKEKALIKHNQTLESEVQKRTIQIENKNKQLKALAQTDYLTGLANRAKIHDALNYTLKRSKYHNTLFGIIMIDIDFFKKVNDTHGHLIGDIVLCEFANQLKENSREVDTVGRWGGEEFFIIIDNTNKDFLLLLAEKFRENINNHTFSTVKHISASFGVAIYQMNDDLKTLITRADTALYLAKEKGRNRIKFIE